MTKNKAVMGRSFKAYTNSNIQTFFNQFVHTQIFLYIVKREITEGINMVDFLYLNKLHKFVF